MAQFPSPHPTLPDGSMPEQSLPTHPHFDFFTDRDIDESDTRPATVYPVRPDDFETREIERLTAKIEAARRELTAVCNTMPPFMQERLDPLRAILECE